jgi:hypothetical protein
MKASLATYHVAPPYFKKLSGIWDFPRTHASLALRDYPHRNFRIFSKTMVGLIPLNQAKDYY